MGVSGVNGGWLGGLLLLGSLLLFVRGSACCGSGVSVGKVINSGLSTVLAVNWARRGQLRRSVNGS